MKLKLVIVAGKIQNNQKTDFVRKASINIDIEYDFLVGELLLEFINFLKSTKVVFQKSSV